MLHCTHCGHELDGVKNIAPKEVPDNKFLDRIAKAQWALFGGNGDGLLYLCPECHRVTPILNKKQVNTFIKHAKSTLLG